MKTAIPSILKWTGSKRSQAQSIAALMPPMERYYEPFIGGGALLFLAGRPGSVAGDLYAPLVDFWRLLQADPSSIKVHYRDQWTELQKDRPGYFYKVRQRFNEDPNPLDLNFLMRTCVNGAVRFNAKGLFNSSFHLSRPGMHPDLFDKIADQWHPRLNGVEFHQGDYELTVKSAGPRDVVYLDPPYAGSRNRYVSDIDVERLFRVLEDLNSRGVKWLLSFDGIRGDSDLQYPVPTSLFQRHLLLNTGHSLMSKVLNGVIKEVSESLYLNF